MGPLYLFGVASDGHVEQWDGAPLPQGILLRWLSDIPGFPERGFDLYRAAVKSTHEVVVPLRSLAATVQGSTFFEHPIGQAQFRSRIGFSFRNINLVVELVVDVLDQIEVRFADPAWSITIVIAPGGRLSVERYAGTGRTGPRDTQTLGDGIWEVRWRTRGIERLVITGDALITQFEYSPLHATRDWRHMVHLCAPVSDERYPCRSIASEPDESVAKSRLPHGVQWTGNYEKIFRLLYPQLRHIVRNEPSVPFQATEGGPTLALNPQTAVMLAALNPHVARILGVAWDDDLKPNGLDGNEWAYKVVGGWRSGDVEGILPYIVALDPGQPNAPSWLSVAQGQGRGPAPGNYASLTWDTRTDFVDPPSFLHQLAAAHLSRDLDAPAPDPNSVQPFGKTPSGRRPFLLRSGEPVLVPRTLIDSPPPKTYYLDIGLEEGWRAWWVRSVDLFGRVSWPAPPELIRLEDNVPPPPPILVSANYIQRDSGGIESPVLPAFAREWRTSNLGRNGIAIAWAWTPELDALCRDVDRFDLVLRRAQSVGTEPQVTWDGAEWIPIESITTATHFDGHINASTADIPVRVTQVSVQAPGVTRCVTDLSLDTGAGALRGAILSQGGREFVIQGNTDGWETTLWIQHEPAVVVPVGDYTLYAADHQSIVRLETDLRVTRPGTTDFFRRFSGVLMCSNPSLRFTVLAARESHFVCVPSGTIPRAGASVRWYPAYGVVVMDTGFGPIATLEKPIAYAQVSAAATRRSDNRPITSPFATPLGITCVDATVPSPPPSVPLATGPFCAELATRADWFGVSRFTLQWEGQPFIRYVIYRALGDAIFLQDRSARLRATTSRSLPDDLWPSEVLADPSRRELVRMEVSELDHTYALEQGEGNTQSRALWQKLHADTQQVLANQPSVFSAYILRTPEPLEADQYTDSIDGRSRAHWFYRIAAVSRANRVGEPGKATPPICCPDVVPPERPLVKQAVSGERVVKLQWLASIEPDLDHYLIFRTAERGKSRDTRDMERVARLPGNPLIAPDIRFSQLPSRILEYADDSAPLEKEVFYRVVAVDSSGNPSLPSASMSGRALVPPPMAPRWDDPTRSNSTILLSWSHGDPNVSCSVERCHVNGSIWMPVSGWLPRGTFSFIDIPPDLRSAWRYRLRTRDVMGRVASSLPVVTLPESE